jgi:hypothetical protein
MLFLTLVIPLLTGAFISHNAEFFDTANKEVEAGHAWHYVGKQPLDPTAKALPLYTLKRKPYILFKLKMEK